MGFEEVGHGKIRVLEISHWLPYRVGMCFAGIGRHAMEGEAAVIKGKDATGKDEFLEDPSSSIQVRRTGNRLVGISWEYA
jgi:hypothetical protein